MNTAATPVNVSYRPYQVRAMPNPFVQMLTSPQSKRHSRGSSAFADAPAFSPPATPPATNRTTAPFGSPRNSGQRTAGYSQYLQPPRSPPVVHVPIPAVASLPRSSPSPSPSPSPTTPNAVQATAQGPTPRDGVENPKPAIVTSVAADEIHALPTPSPTPEQATTESDSGSQPDSPSIQLPALPASRPSSVRSLEPEPSAPLSPGPSSPSSSTAPPVRPALQSALAPRPGSKFRVVSNRVLGTQPARPSPLRPTSHTSAARATHTRTLSNASTRSFAPTSPSPVIASRMTPSASAPIPVALAPPTRESVPERLSPGNRNKPLPNVNLVVSPVATSPRPTTAVLPPRSTTPAGPPRSSTPTVPARSTTPVGPIPQPPVPYAVLSRPTSVSPVPAAGNGSTTTPVGGQKPAPYRAGFQPKGVYRHRTEEFEAARAKRSDAKRTEEKRLARRLEKLIDLHFSPKTEKTASTANRRASSIFDLDLSELKNKSANELWRGVVETKAASHERAIRAPNRPVTCSLLIVADPRTHKIEEVPDIIAYGVVLDEKEKQGFLKGVRQYHMEAATVPAFSRVHQAMLRLEAEIEEDLPQFQELVLSVKTGTHPTSTAATAAARKSLIDRFHEYDRLSKRLQGLPCPSGGSQERMQLAVAARANLFLQKHMFPLQSLPKMKQLAKAATRSETQLSSPAESESSFMLDPGHAVQPLLEQEALLEQMLSEAQAARKIEDALILKTNLAEIREEIRKAVG
ncbi:carboxypeptidase Y-deficient [Ceratobasidium sp. 414]|nr:carboxypeptidase Y-deficient [Ceratobasidium sp. 414]